MSFPRFLLGALTDYQVEPDHPTRTVPKPERRALDKEIRSARVTVATLEQAYGAAAVNNPEGRRPTMRGFKIAHGKIGKELRAARDRLAKIRARRRALPARVEVRDVSDVVVKLASERKHLTNLIKMLAYRAESDLLAFLTPHYARSDDEGRTVLLELFRAAAGIDVTGTGLRVTLHPLSLPHRTPAVRPTVCDTLTETTTVFPGSRLPLRFAIHPRPQRDLAFPGPQPKPGPPAPPPGP